MVANNKTADSGYDLHTPPRNWIKLFIGRSVTRINHWYQISFTRYELWSCRWCCVQYICHCIIILLWFGLSGWGKVNGWRRSYDFWVRRSLWWTLLSEKPHLLTLTATPCRFESQRWFQRGKGSGRGIKYQGYGRSRISFTAATTRGSHSASTLYWNGIGWFLLFWIFKLTNYAVSSRPNELCCVFMEC